MKTMAHSFLFTQAEVQQFIQSVGDKNLIYVDLEAAQSMGYKTIPIPPTMPMIVYKLIETPWKLHHPIIHRKQQCVYHQVMYIDHLYKGVITLEDQFKRHNYTFIKQTLQIHDNNGNALFTGTSHLIAGDQAENN
jgi:N-terminal half of MaoC dehydratase